MSWKRARAFVRRMALRARELPEGASASAIP
jgi:hypothetical protein